MHRRIIRSPRGWVVKESGTDRILAEVPIDSVHEPDAPAERLATQIKALPKLLDFLRHRAFHDDAEAKRLLKEMK